MTTDIYARAASNGATDFRSADGMASARVHKANPDGTALLATVICGMAGTVLYTSRKDAMRWAMVYLQRSDLAAMI